MAAAYLQITDLIVSPKVVNRGSLPRFDWKVKDAAGALAAPGSSMKIRIYRDDGTPVLALTATGVTASVTGTYYYLGTAAVFLTTLTPGRYILELVAIQQVGDQVAAKETFYISDGRV